MRLIRKFKRKGERRQWLSWALGVSALVLTLLIYWYSGATHEPNWLAITVYMYRLLHEVTYETTSPIHQQNRIQCETQRDGRKNWTVLTSVFNNISVYGDVGWDMLAEIIVQKWVNGLHGQALFLSSWASNQSLRWKLKVKFEVKVKVSMCTSWR
jgi:hypothetical protein